MKVRLTVFCISAFLFLFLTPSSAVVDIKKQDENQEITKEQWKQSFGKLSLKKQKRMKKRIQRLKKKMNKKAPLDSGVFQDSKFRLGAIIFLGGLGLLLLTALFITFSSFVIWIANLAILVGLVLMIWALIEY